MMLKKLFVEKTDNTLVQFFRYVFVGGVAFLVDYGILMLLVELFGFYEIAANVISFIAGLAVNYALSTLWVFDESKVKNRMAEFIVFAVIGVIGMLINTGVLWLFTDIFTDINLFGHILPADKYYLIGKIAATGVSFIWNFVARKVILFSKKK